MVVKSITQHTRSGARLHEMSEKSAMPTAIRPRCAATAQQRAEKFTQRRREAAGNQLGTGGRPPSAARASSAQIPVAAASRDVPDAVRGPACLGDGAAKAVSPVTTRHDGQSGDMAPASAVRVALRAGGSAASAAAQVASAAYSASCATGTTG